MIKHHFLAHTVAHNYIPCNLEDEAEGSQGGLHAKYLSPQIYKVCVIFRMSKRAFSCMYKINTSKSLSYVLLLLTNNLGSGTS